MRAAATSRMMLLAFLHAAFAQVIFGRNSSDIYSRRALRKIAR
jgi:hypothetical protein